MRPALPHEGMTQTSPGVWSFDRRRTDPVSGRADQRAALESLAALKAAKHASAVLACLQDGLIILDGAGRIADVNDRFCQITGLGRHELIGRERPYPFWAEGDVEPNMRELSGLLAHAEGRGARAGEIEMFYRRKNGERFPALVTLAQLTDLNGEELGWVSTVKDVSRLRSAELVLRERESQVRLQAATEAALGRIATAAAGATPLAAVLRLGAEEIARLLDADAGMVCRMEGGHATVAAAWGAQSPQVGTRIAMQGMDPTACTGGTGHVKWLDAVGGDRAGGPNGAPLRMPAAASPIRLEEECWGTLVVAKADGALAGDAVERLTRFSSLLAIAVTAGKARAQLQASVRRDPLTRLTNRRGFQELVTSEVSRASRHGSTLSLVVLDLDDLAFIQERHGQAMADKILVEFADRMSQIVRTSDGLARIGARTFAWLLPETDALGAWTAVERARRVLSEQPFTNDTVLRVSAGICDSQQIGADAAELQRRARSALRSARQEGAGASMCYSG